MNTKSSKGFTLVETIISISLFSFILVIILGFFGYAIKGQQKALASQEISDQISYVMEYMGRSIRMSKRDASGTCVGAGTNYSNPYGNNSIRFLNYEGRCQEFYLDNEQLKRRKSNDSGSGGLAGKEVDLTSSKLKINSAKFNIIGDVVGDNTQPRITIFLDVEKKDTKQEFNATVKIQTTISERNLDI
jgi:prepilin-type N-terminal cleavage/methylation domain-containing protein